MNKKTTNFGKLCRKLRIYKGWSMTDVAEKLGYRQNHITQIEQGKSNPTPEFLKKCLEVYEIPENEKADFLAEALASSKRLTLELDEITNIPKEDLAKLMVVLVFNLEEPYSATKEWEAVAYAVKKLFECINNRSLNYSVIQPD
jgi:transcriptional regulator with XRE-family HTH domain